MTEKQTETATDTIPHRILKEASCQPLSGGSTSLLYQIGCDDEKALYVRIKENSGGGFFNKEYVPLQSLLDAISDQQSPFTSSVFKKLFVGRSNNNQCFMLAILLAEGLVTATESHYSAVDPKDFHAAMKGLMEGEKRKKPAAKDTQKEA
mgnify:CR=1 FL=1